VATHCSEHGFGGRKHSKTISQRHDVQRPLHVPYVQKKVRSLQRPHPRGTEKTLSRPLQQMPRGIRGKEAEKEQTVWALRPGSPATDDPIRSSPRSFGDLWQRPLVVLSSKKFSHTPV